MIHMDGLEEIGDALFETLDPKTVSYHRASAGNAALPVRVALSSRRGDVRGNANNPDERQGVKHSVLFPPSIAFQPLKGDWFEWKGNVWRLSGHGEPIGDLVKAPAGVTKATG